MASQTFICGGDTRPGPRDDCHNQLHDHPLPSGYVDASETASRRLARGWTSRRCPDCSLYGWIPGRPLRDGSDAQVPCTCSACKERAERDHRTGA